jgi:hypothetical protein
MKLWMKSPTILKRDQSFPKAFVSMNLLSSVERLFRRYKPYIPNLECRWELSREDYAETV